MEDLALALGRQQAAVGVADVAVHVPLDVLDVMLAENAAKALGQVVDHVVSGQIQHQLIAAHRGLPAGQRERPVRMRAVQIAVLVDHLRLKPQAEAEAQRVDPLDEPAQAALELRLVDKPVAQTAVVVVAAAEPAVVEHQHVDAHARRLLGNGDDLVGCKVKKGRFPVVDEHRALGEGEAAADDAAADEAVIAARQRAQALVREGEQRLGRMEGLARLKQPGEHLVVDAAAHARHAVGIDLDVRAVAAGIHRHDADAVAGLLGGRGRAEDDKGVVMMAGGAAAGGDGADAAGQRGAVRLAFHLVAAVEMNQLPGAVGHIQIERHDLLKGQPGA